MYMVTISLKIPDRVLKMIDDLVEEGLYPSRSEFIRTAIIQLLRRELRVRENARKKQYLS